MNCPGCAAAMVSETLEGHLGRPVALDLCFACQVFWFDKGESLQLAPRATLQLFRTIGEQAASRQGPLPLELSCPRCSSLLLLTHDKQRNTRFRYWRCSAQHGRLITFFDFQREKDFIRPLSKEQIEELRRQVQAVNCSNCGAAVDLAQASACGHCGSPLSMLDGEQARRLVEQLQRADRTGKPIDPTLPLALERARRETERAFAAFEQGPDWLGATASTDVVGAGLVALARWLGKSAR